MKDPSKLDHLSDILWELLYLQLGAYSQAARLRKLKEVLEPYFLALEDTQRLMTLPPVLSSGGTGPFLDGEFLRARAQLAVYLADLGFKQE